MILNGSGVLNGYVATVDADGTEHTDGHVTIHDGVITEVGAGRHPDGIDLAGCLITPGLVNTHHHLYQWATRGFAVDSGLFDWLRTLYPIWAGIDEETVGAAARTGLARLARTGCTTTTDHHYVFPAAGGDVLGATIAAAGEVGLRFHPTRGSMDLGASDGGLPPDSVVERLDAVLAATHGAIDRWHDPASGAMVRIGVAPCSPFSVTKELMTESAALARSYGVRLHTHLAETLDEEVFCRERFGVHPVDYLAELGWLGDDVWLGHGVHLDDRAVTQLATSHTAVAHCPSSNGRLGSGIAPVRALLDAGATVGLGVDGAASNEHGGLADEMRQATYFARVRGDALTCRDALRLATMGGAGCLGRTDEIGSLEPGKRADIAVWRVDGPAHGDLDDPLTALVLGPPAPLELLLVDGRVVVERDELRTLDERAAAVELRAARATLLERARA